MGIPKARRYKYTVVFYMNTTSGTLYRNKNLSKEYDVKNY